MEAENGSRVAILERIRAANGRRETVTTPAGEWEAIKREYRHAEAMEEREVLALFVERLRDYDAHVVSTPLAEVRSCVADRLAERGNPRMIVPGGFPPEMLAPGGRFVEDVALSTAELDGFDGVLTTATVAIAETGTLVLQNVPGQGRRAATLVPDYHLCVLYAGQVVRSVPEAMARLGGTATLPTTFVSGPSATADIEMTRIKGVHGPRFLDVIVIAE